MRNYLRTILVLPLATIAFLMGGCPWVTSTGMPGDGNAALRRFASPNELLNYFKQQATARHNWTSTFFRGGLGLSAPAAIEGVLAVERAGVLLGNNIRRNCDCELRTLRARRSGGGYRRLLRPVLKRLPRSLRSL